MTNELNIAQRKTSAELFIARSANKKLRISIKRCLRCQKLLNISSQCQSYLTTFDACVILMTDLQTLCKVFVIHIINCN